ncbi:Zn-dependent hydrolase [Paraburkholderia fungorum]|uniref:Zn-dependent hydrolase n=1 Tax=Paraburkholderia fungorum TaxID=134537 RepID=A0A420H118_9BURK|nr:Zn-dependent hydrolase [Paraburkholderia fungorum]RKF51051.1 Zn-dependent hydrolase [Paraburkholderia fungorum]
MSKLPFPPINAERLNARVERLSQFTRADVPWTRRAFSPLFEEARAWLRGEFLGAGLSVSQDAGGNLIGRREGSGRASKPLITGSHCDTVVGGGRFDGIIGVLAGIEVAHTLNEQGITLDHPFEVIDFLSEEPSDYGISCVGSRAFSGVLDAGMLVSKNADGESLRQALQRIGGNPDALTQALRAPESTAAFVELHIEQGPVLESRQLPIGVVTNIVGIRRVLITVTGQPDHAGTTPMDIRRDALVGAARLIDGAYRLASKWSGHPHYVVATIGRIAMTPNVPNAVPGHVELMLEVRSDSDAVLDCFPEDLMAGATAALAELRVSASAVHVSRSKPTDCQPLVMNAVERAAEVLGYATMRLPSGAGHDAVYVAPTGPIGMIFIPCLNGRSHCPEEWIEPQQLLDGTRVLYQTIRELDASL